MVSGCEHPKKRHDGRGPVCVRRSQRTLSFGQHVVGMELQALLGHVTSVFVCDGSLWLP